MTHFMAHFRLGIIVAVAYSPAMVAEAANRFYVGPASGPTAVWNSTASWSASSGGPNGAAIPITGDIVNITNTDGVNRNVTYDYTGAAVTIGSLTLDLNNGGNATAGTNTLSINANNTLTATSEIFGNTNHGTGAVTQSLGTNSVTTEILGNAAGSSGTYTLSGGTHTVTANLELGGDALGSGTFNLSGGNLAVATTGVASSNAEFVGYLGTGSFTQSGGSHTIGTVAVNQLLIVGTGNNAVGSYTLNNSGATLTVNGGEIVGQSATGTSSGGAIIQYGGTFNQSAGAHTVTTSLSVGSSSFSSGSFSLSGGSLAVATTGAAFSNVEYIGNLGTGSFSQNGGSHTIGTAAAHQQLYLGYGPSGLGSYKLNGSGATLTVNGAEFVGFGATGNLSGGAYGGTFNQIAGSHTVADGLYLGNNSGGTGNFSLSGGSLAVGTTGAPGASEYVGYSGTGSFTQTGGTNTIGTAAQNQDLYLGYNAASFGSYSVLAAASLSVNGNAFVGGSGIAAGGEGTFNVSSGSATISGLLKIWNSGSSAVSLSGGALSIGSLDTSGNPLRFNWTAGSLNFLNGVTIDSSFVLGQSPVLSAAMGLSSGGTLVNNGQISLSGGFLGGTGSLKNNNVITGYGTIGGSGGFSNFGQLNIVNGSLLLINAGANANSNLVNLAASESLVLSAGNLTNTGLVVLDGSAVSGTASLINSSGGEVRGNGSITAPITNSGGLIHATGTTVLLLANLSGGNTSGGELRVEDGSTLNVVNSFTSDGTIVLGGADAQLGGGVITNSGQVRGGGRVANRVLNSGSVRSESGDLTLGNSSNTNTSLGRIEALAGTRVIYSQGLATNDGTISLSGGTFDNNNHALSNSNTGIINGYGTLRTGGLTSTGKLNVGEGNLDVFGNVINNGTIGIQGGRSLYFFGNVSGSGSYTGVGTATFLAAVSPGNSPASVAFGGNVDLTSTATLNMELAGATPGAQYDQIHVTGQLTLGGALQVLLLNSFAPAAGQSFDLFDWGSLSGTFASIQLPALAGGLTWNTSQLYTAGLLSVNLLGDYNGNGVVDAADYTVWRDTLGSTTDLRANGDNTGASTGIVDQADYNVWKANFGAHAGSGSGAGAAVPEPATLLMLLVGMMTLCCRRRPKVS